MKNISKFKVAKGLIFPLIIFAIISITTIYSTKNLLPTYYSNAWIKQLIWYVIGFVIAFLMMFLRNRFLYNNAKYLYIINVILLILVLFFGTKVNGTVGWFKVFGIMSFQPAEFMKVTLILYLATFINDYNEKNPTPSLGKEFLFIIKILIIVLIPSILTFIQPDTGAVIIYFAITLSMLFISGIKKRWFIIMLIFIIIGIGSFLLLFFYNKDMFIDIFGTNFFYRIDRLLNWSSGSGDQLQGSLIAIGSSGMFGHGFNNIPLYFPEPHTDFIFASYASCYGLLGTFFLIIIITYFDINLISSVTRTYEQTNKFVISGIIGMLLYQQIQNIGMTLGLLPITGITLPFISYGGSSLLSYMIIVGIIFNVSNENLRYTN